MAAPEAPNASHSAKKSRPRRTYCARTSRAGINTAAPKALACSSAGGSGGRASAGGSTDAERQKTGRSGSRCSNQCPSSWAIVNRRRGGHWRASSALIQISPPQAASGRTGSGQARARARRARVEDPRRHARGARRGCRRSLRPGRATTRRPRCSPGRRPGTVPRLARCCPSAAIVITGVGHSKPPNERAVRAVSSDSGRGALPASTRASSSTSLQSPTWTAWRTSAIGSRASGMVVIAWVARALGT